MLAVALNYRGRLEDRNFSSIFIRQFADFKLLKLIPYDEAAKERLQLCQPEEYEELMKHILKKWEASGAVLEMRGLKVKLLRAVRRMLFFDEEKSYEKVFLEGCDAIKDFPWALQIVVVQGALPEAGLNPGLIKKADILILNDMPEAESKGLTAIIKMKYPDTPVFAEKTAEGFSPELKDALEALFAVYLEQRERIKVMLEESLFEASISCEQAWCMAEKLKVSSFLFGNVCDEYGYSISHCGLSCF